jgi:hypothetical protein
MGEGQGEGDRARAPVVTVPARVDRSGEESLSFAGSGAFLEADEGIGVLGTETEGSRK